MSIAPQFIAGIGLINIFSPVGTNEELSSLRDFDFIRRVPRDESRGY